MTMDQQRRRACFVVLITNDAIVESPETFSLVLTLDPASAGNFSDILLQISPSVAYVDIEGTFDHASHSYSVDQNYYSKY